MRITAALCGIVFYLILFLLPASSPWQTEGRPVDGKPLFDPESLPIPFQRFTTTDQHGRTITAYLSRAVKDSKESVPVVLWIQGSGCQKATCCSF